MYGKLICLYGFLFCLWLLVCMHVGEGDVPRMQSVHRQPLPLEQVPGPADNHDGIEFEFQGLTPEHHEQELLSNDEAHDKLMDLPFAGEMAPLQRRHVAQSHSAVIMPPSEAGLNNCMQDRQSQTCMDL
jgi:hypothetical protein